MINLLLIRALFIMLIVSLKTVNCQNEESGRIKNSKCNSDSQCQVYKHAYCLNYDADCSCYPGYVPVYNKTQTTCEKLATKINDECQFQEQCQLSLGMESICLKEKCVCRNGTEKGVYEPGNNYCYQGETSKYSCISNSNCNGEECDLNFCKCRNFKIMRKVNGTFLCLSVSQSDCVIDEQCQYGVMGTESQCKHGKCECKVNFIQNATSVCVKQLDEECVNDSDCIYNTCIKKKCECPPNKIFSKDHLDCFDMHTRNLNDNCSINEQCLKFINDSHCTNFCRCNANFIEANGSCLKESDTLGSSCETDQQCTAYLKYAQCINNVCGCKSGYHEANKQCFATATYKSSCEVTENCALFYGICKGSICQCNDEEIFSESKKCEKSPNVLIPIIIGTLLVICIIIVLVILYRKGERDCRFSCNRLYLE